jgi:lipid A disaccharide synthetase
MVSRYNRTGVHIGSGNQDSKLTVDEIQDRLRLTRRAVAGYLLMPQVSIIAPQVWVFPLMSNEQRHLYALYSTLLADWNFRGLRFTIHLS